MPESVICRGVWIKAGRVVDTFTAIVATAPLANEVGRLQMIVGVLVGHVVPALGVTDTKANPVRGIGVGQNNIVRRRRTIIGYS